MPTASQNYFQAKFAYTLIIIIALGYLYTIGHSIISPLLMAVLFAILLRPVVAYLQDKLHFPNAIASLVSVLLFFLAIAGIFYFISTQVVSMASDWDNIKRNLSDHYQHIQTYISDTFNVSKKEQNEFLKEAEGDGKALVGTTLLSFTDVLLSTVVIPIYMFMILLYRTHFGTFLSRLFDAKHHAKLQDIISTIKVSVQSYILGLMLEVAIVSTLTTVGLWIIGVKYALVLGIITGILNLIPYIGIFIAGLLTVIASLSGSSDLSIVIGILVVNLVVQFIDNNLLVPMVVSSKVEINSLATLVGIIVAGTMAGIAGMFLAIPLMAICKVIFDRVPGLEPWGYFLGDDLPKNFSFRKRKRTAPIEKIVKD